MRLRISPLCVFTWRDGQMVCDDPVQRKQLALSPAAQRVLPHFADWAEAGDAADSVSVPNPRLVRDLHKARILVEEGSPEHRLADSLGPWEQWGTAATYYHLSTRTARDEHFLTAAEDTDWLVGTLPDRPQPPALKEYPDAARHVLPPVDRLKLAAGGLRSDGLVPDGSGADRTASDRLASVLRARRTTRAFDAHRAMSEEELSVLLHWVAAPQHEVGSATLRPSLLRTSPSGGARHSLEVYPVVLGIDGVPSGVYHYHPTAHALERLGEGPVTGADAAAWCGDQSYVRGAGVLLFYTSVLDRVAWKYRMARTYRTLYMELGHFSQTTYLVGTALGLGVFFTAATRDAAVEELLGLDWREEIFLGLNGVGVPSPEESRRQRAMLDGGPAAFSFARDDWDGLGT
ncbi:SagB/ThcOx family dehydrogenase [Streptomyces sp. NPDC088923]|uniref:SagB/ThcOx family dehydrogenase n=1 Tax=Streptomyces sp. NPDC088923 TaxID=3365913 RepID=UPI003820ECE3